MNICVQLSISPTVIVGSQDQSAENKDKLYNLKIRLKQDAHHGDVSVKK